MQLEPAQELPTALGASRHRDRAADVVTMGETMVMLVPEGGESIASARAFAAHVGGAESNVAVYLARMGIDVRWFSVLREEPLAFRIVAELEAAGVDTAGVRWTQAGRTGIYLKDPGAAGSNVYYYRDQSPARLLDSAVWEDQRLRHSRVLHLSGITAALSTSARKAVEDAVVGRMSGADIVSFDINYRAALWPREEAAEVLGGLARAADIVFVGLDEARELWGCITPESVARVLQGAGVIVVKDGANGASALTGDETVFVESRCVQVVEPVGAGDAFAAGYIAGVLQKRSVKESLRLGHLFAESALQVYGDIGEQSTDEWLQREISVTDEAWQRHAAAGEGS